ncbi:hypothetical protein BU16DRAFT_85678 [Lophium mytilinum]|uniref:EthD domain-containing protein n=1 Tax=Lophium mytilinum TaxID=390894 RepID=A0A6A6QJF6_9PEZI|nr:hypothetical protein BU16DRAFT_85678 [Lophium mytilinum]
MASENLIRISSFIRRKPGVSKEEFYQYWTQVHGPLCTDFMMRHGVVEYVQVLPLLPAHPYPLTRGMQKVAHSTLILPYTHVCR